MIKFYFASITDHKGEEIINTELCVSPRQAAYKAQQVVKNCPPAQGFNVHVSNMTKSDILYMINNKIEA